MKYKPFYISAYEANSGLDKYGEPFIIPEKAFPVLNNAYSYRGRITRRSGFINQGRLCRNLTQEAQTNTDGSGTYTDTDLLSAYRATEPNAQIVPGSVTLTIDRGTIDESIYEDTNADGEMIYISGTYTISAGTINYRTGEVNLTFTVAPAAATAVDADLSYCPTFPVMGIRLWEQSAINEENTIAFDTKYAYRFIGTSWEELPAVTPTTWQGNNSDFFWSTNYWSNANGDIFWATNFNKGVTPDPIRYYDSVDWTTFNPIVNGTTRLQQARILLPYKDRLLAFNVYEGNTLAAATQFPQRLRFSQNGDPTDLANGWRDDINGRGGFIEIPTNEHIVTAFFQRDVLIVKCERSSWKVVYTSNESLPFVFQKINSEMGAESTFSIVPFDDGVLSIGNYGITVDDSVNVRRIDEKIPDTVFNIQNDNEGPKRVQGIRDFSRQIVYWTYPSSATDLTFPNRLLIYNYVNGTFAEFDDSFTALGYFQSSGDYTWATLPYINWDSWGTTWISGRNQARFPNVMAGNQLGYTLIVQGQNNNGTSLPIINFTTTNINIPNHNLQDNDFVRISGCIGGTPPNGTVGRVTVSGVDDITLTDSNNTPITYSGTYIGGGELTVIPNVNIKSKVFSPFYDEGAQVKLGYIDFFLDNTVTGEFTLNLFVNEAPTLSINDPSIGSNVGLLGDNIVLTRPENTTLIPFQQNQIKIWHRIYVHSIVQNFQWEMTLDDAQMFDDTINERPIVLHASVLYFSDNVRLIQ